MNRSTLGHHATGRRAGQRFDAEHGTATEALLFLGDLDPEAIGPSIAHATHYEPTPMGELERLLAAVTAPLERMTFVDLGSGMARAVLLAARLPFRQVIGVEISPALHAVARDNVAAHGTAGLACRDIRLVRGDAATFRVPAGDLVVYLYNPFDAAILGPVVARLAALEPEREIAIANHTPVERATIEARGDFTLVGEEAFGAVWERLRRP